MRTALSSAAAPGATLEELLAGLARHGLDALEVRVGDAHALGTERAPEELLEARRLLDAAGVRVAGLLAPADADPAPVARAVRGLHTRWMIDASLPFAARLARANQAAATGVPVAVVVRGPSADDEAHRAIGAGHPLVWEAHPDDAPLDALCERVMRASGGNLIGVRVCGGGPEGSLHEGRGIGAVMARLALAGFGGAVVLAPSDPRYHLLWNTWLGRRGGFGCGTKAAGTAERPLRHLPLAEETA